MKRTDLAMEYFPDLQPRAAVRKLHSWIVNCPDLVAELTARNRKFFRCRDLTVRQVLLIKHYLGEP